jgi:hypothetical protein
MSDHTGWPPGLLQDDDRKLSRWFAGRPGARGQVDELHGLPELAPQGSGIDGEARVRTVLAWPTLDIQQPAEDVQQASGGQAGGDGGSGALALQKQVGGDHYKSLAIQPVEFITKNNIPFLEANAIKYLVRHKSKGGAADIRKALHYCELILSLQYGEDA